MANLTEWKNLRKLWEGQTLTSCCLYSFFLLIFIAGCVGPATESDGIKCPNCEGSLKKYVCGVCRGKGRVITHHEDVWKACENCDGFGRIPKNTVKPYERDSKNEKYEDCSVCRGSGKKVKSMSAHHDDGDIWEACYSCDGRGRVRKKDKGKKGREYEDCSVCRGSGKKSESRPVYADCTLCVGTGKGSFEMRCNWCRGTGYVKDAWWRFGPSESWVPPDELKSFKVK